MSFCHSWTTHVATPFDILGQHHFHESTLPPLRDESSGNPAVFFPSGEEISTTLTSNMESNMHPKILVWNRKFLFEHGHFRSPSRFKNAWSYWLENCVWNPSSLCYVLVILLGLELLCFNKLSTYIFRLTFSHVNGSFEVLIWVDLCNPHFMDDWIDWKLMDVCQFMNDCKRLCRFKLFESSLSWMITQLTLAKTLVEMDNGINGNKWQCLILSSW